MSINEPAGALERLRPLLDLGRDLIPLGTLRLESVIRPASGTAEQPPSDYNFHKTWTSYIPGCLQDLADIRLDQRKRLAAVNGLSYKGRPSSRAGSSSPQKRKRSPSIASTSTSPSTPHSGSSRQHNLGDEPLPPTLRELDHLVQNAFIAVEYVFIDAIATTNGKQDGQKVKVEPNDDVSMLGQASPVQSNTESSPSPCIFRIYALPMDTPKLNLHIETLGLTKIRSKNNLGLAHKTFAKLLHHLHYDRTEWHFAHAQGTPDYLLYRSRESLSILEVYNSLEDPTPQPLVGLTTRTKAVLDDILHEDAPEGMSSRLYGFQKTCLWKLAARELAPSRQIDLCFRQCTAMDIGPDSPAINAAGPSGSKDGVANPPRTYFIDPNMMVWNSAQYYRQPKAAIVAEGMGTGKTCICLALILVTKHQLANIDEVEDQADLSGRITSRRTARSENFPWVDQSSAEVLAQESMDAQVQPLQIGSSGVDRTLKSVPSLFDLSLDLILCSTHVRAIRLPLLANQAQGIEATTDLDLPYVWEIPIAKARNDTRSVAEGKRKICISAATLVIVPDILVAQWLAETHKHIEEGALDYIKIEKDDVVPPAHELSKLDLVIISESKVRAEESRFWPVPAPPCRCPYLGSSRVVACKCKKVINLGMSPLMGVWWKRLIVDEGHKVAGNGELVQMCMRLRTESRYVVSGTPSKNLVGLHDVGTVEDEQHQTESSAEGDTNDFERLARICTFIGMQPFAKNPNLFMKAFHEPYTIRGDTTGIKAFLARTMVRHRVPDVAMPPLTRRVVTLEFNELERMTYNVLLALFVSNSVLSERQDEDYFFHPKNKGPLSSLLSNLGAAHLLFSSPELREAAQNAYSTNVKAIQQNDARSWGERHKWSRQDEMLIDQAQKCLLSAMEDSLWKLAQKGSMLYGLDKEGLAPELLQIWDGFELPSTQMAFTGERLTSLRYQIGKLVRDPQWELRSGEELEEELITIATKEKHAILAEALEREQARAKGLVLPKKKKVKRNAKDAVSATKAAAGAFKKNAGDGSDVFTYRHLPLTSHLDQSLIPSIVSTKVAYVVKSIIENPAEKFLVFAGGSSSMAHVASNNLFYLAEALDLADIPFLIFARTLSQEKLAAYAKAFSESTAFRVLLLDLKFAARGLTLSKATRIIFTEPVWDKDEEAQAVKRAHRLGQDKPVHVETLVMKDSFEESVLRRGAQLSRRETAGAKTPYQDTHLSAVLKSMTFLPEHIDKRQPLFAPILPPLRLIPQHLHDSDRHNLDIELARFRQLAQEDLAAQLETHTRAGSVARSRSSTPASKQDKTVPQKATQTAPAPAPAAKSSLASTARHASPLKGEFRPRGTPGWKSTIINIPARKKEASKPGILMSSSRPSLSDSTSEDDVVVVTNSRRAAGGVRFS